MRDELWGRIEAALDARRSPFEDALLAAELRADPASAAAVSRLLAGFARLAEAEPVPRRSRRRAVLAAASALLLAVSLAVALARGRAEAGRAEPASGMQCSLVERRVPLPPARAARVELVPRRVLAWTVEGETP